MLTNSTPRAHPGFSHSHFYGYSWTHHSRWNLWTHWFAWAIAWVGSSLGSEVFGLLILWWKLVKQSHEFVAMDMVKLHPFVSLFVGQIVSLFCFLNWLLEAITQKPLLPPTSLERIQWGTFPNTCSFQPYHYNKDFRVLANLMARSYKIHRLIIDEVILLDIQPFSSVPHFLPIYTCYQCSDHWYTS